MTSTVDIANRALATSGARAMIASLDERSAEAYQCKLWLETLIKQVSMGAHWNFLKKFVVGGVLKAAPGTPEFGNLPISGSPFSSGFSGGFGSGNTLTGWDSSLMPPPPWAYSYGYPTDCLTMRYVLAQIPGFQQGAAPAIWPGMGVQWPYPNAAFEVSTDSDGANSRVKVILTNAQLAILCYTCLVDDPNVWSEAFTQAIVSALAGRICIPLSGSKELASQCIQEANGFIQTARLTDGNEGTTVNDIVPDWLRIRGVCDNGWDQVTVSLPPFGPLLSGF